MSERYYVSPVNVWVNPSDGLYDSKKEKMIMTFGEEIPDYYKYLLEDLLNHIDREYGKDQSSPE